MLVVVIVTSWRSSWVELVWSASGFDELELGAHWLLFAWASWVLSYFLLGLLVQRAKGRTRMGFWVGFAGKRVKRVGVLVVVLVVILAEGWWRLGGLESCWLQQRKQEGFWVCLVG
ncbi:hypothetical protein KY289_009015 [Solanum tuberosum]|uniref:GG25239 n=1 Tax=Solanum tuberosum TaxID=4113 RepID=M1BM21_SOLTU|nr:hypothetical protein KY289_009015 [Solanum tuberosum]